MANHLSKLQWEFRPGSVLIGKLWFFIGDTLSKCEGWDELAWHSEMEYMQLASVLEDAASQLRQAACDLAEVVDGG